MLELSFASHCHFKESMKVVRFYLWSYACTLGYERTQAVSNFDEPLLNDTQILKKEIKEISVQIWSTLNQRDDIAETLSNVTLQSFTQVISNFKKEKLNYEDLATSNHLQFCLYFALERLLYREFDEKAPQSLFASIERESFIQVEKDQWLPRWVLRKMQVATAMATHPKNSSSPMHPLASDLLQLIWQQYTSSCIQE